MTEANCRPSFIASATATSSVTGAYEKPVSPKAKERTRRHRPAVAPALLQAIHRKHSLSFLTPSLFPHRRSVARHGNSSAAQGFASSARRR